MSRDFYRNRCKLGSIPQINTAAPVLYEDFEDDNLVFNFTFTGTGSWARSNVSAHTGTYCYRGATSASATATTTFTSPKTGTLSIWYRIHSESVSYDWGKIFINEVQKLVVGGADTGWVNWTSPITQGDVIRFDYRKDSSGDVGLDAFLIDDIQIS